MYNSLYDMYFNDVYPPVLFKRQIVNNLLFSTDNLNIRSYRQSGMTYLSLNYILHYSNLNPNKTIFYIVSNLSYYDYNSVQRIISDNEIEINHISKDKIYLSNNSVINIVSFSQFDNCVRGHTPSLIVFDSIVPSFHLSSTTTKGIANNIYGLLSVLTTSCKTRIVSFSTGLNDEDNGMFKLLSKFPQTSNFEYPWYHNPKYNMEWYNNAIQMYGMDRFISGYC